MSDVLIYTADETAILGPIVSLAGNHVVEVDTAGDVLREVLYRPLDVVIIPDNFEPVEGVELLAVLRRMTPAVIVMIGSGDDTRAAEALLQGADAYIKAPVDILTFTTRLRSIVRPRRKQDRAEQQFHVDDQLVQELGLTRVERRLLQALAVKCDAVVASDQLAETVWGDSSKRSALRFYIRQLRQKLGRVGVGSIEGQHGVGYRLVVSPEWSRS